MKPIPCIFFFLFLAFSASAQRNAPEMRFEKDVHDFGIIVEGEVVLYTFTYQNTGNAPLVITEITNSCGCTTPQFSREPVMPGQTGTVSISYNSRGWPGSFNKEVIIKTNERSPRHRKLFVKGEVVQKSKSNIEN